ncbi:MAG: molybdenum cofactor guanylyltransferase [Chloroflexi bacterium]|nr:molybdenum cofactor guanylyltransferase [Chloroflexota bacterium]
MSGVWPISVVVLAGGKSRRLGRDKATEKLEGETLLARVLRMLAPLSQDRVVVLDGERGVAGLPQGVRLVTDIYPNMGSLGGLYSGLMAAALFHSLVVACDMPFLNLSLLRYMVTLASDFDVVIPWRDGEMEPLHAIYSKNCLGPMEDSLRRGQLKIISFLSQVRVRYLNQEEVSALDPEQLSFFNINDAVDLEKAHMLARGMAPTSPYEE